MMRLDVVAHPQRTRVRLFTTMTRWLSGVDMADIVKTLLYRPEFFGRPMLALTVDVMRGDSPWTVAEREHLAERTARQHSCSYCRDVHGEIVKLAAGGPMRVSDRLAATADLVTAVTANATVDPGPVRAAGVSEAAIRDALYVNFMWNIVNRLALSFGFEMRPGQLEAGAKALHRFGYRLPGFLLGGAATPATGPDRHADEVADLLAVVRTGPGVTTPELRTAAADGGDLPDDWRDWTALVRESASSTTDADVAALRQAGHSEDEIFEMTVAAAVGAAHHSLLRGLAAID